MIEAVFIGTFVPLALMVAFLRHSRPIFSCFCWGMASFMLVFAISPPIHQLFGIEADMMKSAVYLGPPLEELLKPLPLYFIALFAVRSLVPFFYILGLACGIGFAIEENLIYLVQLHPDAEESRTLMVLRSFSTCLMHGVATGFTGYTLTLSTRHRGFVAILLTLAGIITASAYHGFFNWLMLHGHMSFGVLLALVVFGVFVTTMKSLEARAPETRGTVWE